MRDLPSKVSSLHEKNVDFQGCQRSWKMSCDFPLQHTWCHHQFLDPIFTSQNWMPTKFWGFEPPTPAWCSQPPLWTHCRQLGPEFRAANFNPLWIYPHGVPGFQSPLGLWTIFSTESLKTFICHWNPGGRIWRKTTVIQHSQHPLMHPWHTSHLQKQKITSSSISMALDMENVPNQKGILFRLVQLPKWFVPGFCIARNSLKMYISSQPLPFMCFR